MQSGRLRFDSLTTALKLLGTAPVKVMPHHQPGRSPGFLRAVYRPGSGSGTSTMPWVLSIVAMLSTTPFVSLQRQESAEDFAADIGMLTVLCDDRTITGCFSAEAQTSRLAKRMNVGGDCTSARLLADCLTPCKDSQNETRVDTYNSAAARQSTSCAGVGDVCDDLTPSFCLAAYQTQVQQLPRALEMAAETAESDLFATEQRLSCSSAFQLQRCLSPCDSSDKRGPRNAAKAAKKIAAEACPSPITEFAASTPGLTYCNATAPMSCENEPSCYDGFEPSCQTGFECVSCNAAIGGCSMAQAGGRTSTACACPASSASSATHVLSTLLAHSFTTHALQDEAVSL